MSKEKVWVTKHALTDGIREIECVIQDDTASWYTGSSMVLVATYGRDEWFRSLDDAVSYVELLREIRVKSLRDEADRLDAAPLSVKKVIDR